MKLLYLDNLMIGGNNNKEDEIIEGINNANNRVNVFMNYVLREIAVGNI